MKKFAIAAAILMALAVIVGAMGAHALEGKITSNQLLSYQTGVRYHLVHGLALLILSLTPYGSLKWRKRAAGTMLAGTLFFSISIYLLSTSSMLGTQSWSSWLGPITPIGGLLLILSWIFLAIDLSKIKSVK